jgi:hypothetical protein
VKITAALAWWDELPEDLDRCVRSLGNIADKVVAVDGAYRRYPGATITSPQDQVVAIREAATSVGIECEVIQIDRLWAGQVEKRAHLLNAASIGSDWIAVVDTDHVVSTDRELARDEISRMGTDIDVISVPFFTPSNDERDVDVSAATGWHKSMVDQRLNISHLFRALPGLTVERFHWWYMADKNGKRVQLRYGMQVDDGHSVRVLEPVPLRTPYVVTHLCLTRDEKHILANRAFCNDRIMVVERTKQEDDVPGLPEPVFDYITIPY